MREHNAQCFLYSSSEEAAILGFLLFTGEQAASGWLFIFFTSVLFARTKQNTLSAFINVSLSMHFEIIKWGLFQTARTVIDCYFNTPLLFIQPYLRTTVKYRRQTKSATTPAPFINIFGKEVINLSLEWSSSGPRD